MVIADHAFLAHPRITNPTDCDLQGYWWTCVAVEAKPSTRIFTPATHVAGTVLYCTTLPSSSTVVLVTLSYLCHQRCTYPDAMV